MKIKSYFFNVLFSFIFGFVLLFAIVIVFNGNSQEPKSSPAQDSKSPNKIKVSNKTASLQIVRVEVVGEKINLLLKNNYSKSINSFYLSSGTSQYHAELIYSDIQNEILPNEQYSFSLPVDEKTSSTEVTLRAVLFVDGTDDGEDSSIKEMKGKRFGEKTQFIQGLEWLQQAKEASPSKVVSEVTNLKLKVSSLPDKDDKKSSAVNSGLHFGKQRLLRYIQEILISNKPSATSQLPKDVFESNSRLSPSKETEELSEANVQIRISVLQAKLERIISAL